MNVQPKEGGLLATLRSVKHIEWILLLLAVGILMLVAANALPRSSPAMADTAIAAPTEPLERRMEAILSQIDGAGRVRVLVNHSETSEEGRAVTGVLVVADGADDLSVRLELARAVQSLLDVPQGNIEIFPMQKESEE